jgi:hypothetical protein
MQPEKFEAKRTDCIHDEQLATRLKLNARITCGDASSSRVSLVGVAGANGCLLEPAFYIQATCVQEAWTARPHPQGLNAMDFENLVTMPTEYGVATLDATVQMIRLKVEEIRNYPTKEGRQRLEGIICIVMDAPKCHGYSEGGGKLHLKMLDLAAELDLVFVPLPANTR